MATTGQVITQGTINGAPAGYEGFTDTQTFTAAIGSIQQIALSSGNNTITIPTGTTYMRVLGPNAASPQPNPTYAGLLTEKGAAGDTGVPFSATYGLKRSFDSVAAAPASIVINASVSTTVTVLFW